MNKKEPAKDSAELFRRIRRLSCEAEWSDEELREGLREEGINPNELVGRILADVKRFTKESPLYWRNKARIRRTELLNRMATARLRTSVRGGLNREELLRKIKTTAARLTGPDAEQFAFAFRRFEACTEEDLASILEDLEIIEKLEADEADE
jgi:hypothetical protein